MTNLLPKKFQDKLISIPKHLQFATGPRGMKYAELLAAVDAMDKERAIRFSKEEYKAEYGNNGVAGLKGVAKKQKLNFMLRVVEDGNSILVFKNDLQRKAA